MKWLKRDTFLVESLAMFIVKLVKINIDKMFTQATYLLRSVTECHVLNNKSINLHRQQRKCMAFLCTFAMYQYTLLTRLAVVHLKLEL